MKPSNRAFILAYLNNLLTQFSVNALGIISTIVLLRLLTPSDFGIVAIGILIVEFFKMLAESSVGRYLMLLEAPTTDDYNAAWTLQIMFRTSMVIILLFSTPFISGFINMNELEVVIAMLCASEFISQFNNIWVLRSVRELDFKTVNKIKIFAKFTSVAMTIATAYVFKNYVALLVGTLFMGLVNTVLSFVMVREKPSLCFKIKPAMFSFTFKLMVRNIFGFSRSKLDSILISKLFGEASLGQYTVANRFALMPSKEIITPSLTPTLAYMSRIQHRKDELHHKTLQILFSIFLFLSPFFWGLLAIPDSFVEVVMGQKWLDVAEFIGLVGFLMLILPLPSILNNLYDVNDKVNWAILPDVLSITLLASSFFLIDFSGLLHFVKIRIIIAIFMTLCMITLACSVSNIPKLKMFLAILIPMLISMPVISVSSLRLEEYSLYYAFSIELVVGFFVYLAFLILFSFVIIRYFEESFIGKLIPEKILNTLKIFKVKKCKI